MLANRFLTPFVLRHITGPLDELARATRAIHDASLSNPALLGDSRCQLVKSDLVG